MRTSSGPTESPTGSSWSSSISWSATARRRSPDRAPRAAAETAQKAPHSGAATRLAATSLSEATALYSLKRGEEPREGASASHERGKQRQMPSLPHRRDHLGQV